MVFRTWYLKEAGVESISKSMFLVCVKNEKILQLWTIFGLIYFFMCLILNYKKNTFVKMDKNYKILVNGRKL